MGDYMSFNCPLTADAPFFAILYQDYKGSNTMPETKILNLHTSDAF